MLLLCQWPVERVVCARYVTLPARVRYVQREWCINCDKCGLQELLRARHLTMAQVGRLEEAWKTDPAASLDTLTQPSADEEPAPVALKCVPVPMTHACFEAGLFMGK